MQTPDHTLSSAIGSCRDSAWLLVSLLRELGLAARFVSGYLVQLTSDIAVAGRPVRPGRGLHRPARLGRGVHPGRRLDRHGPDVGPVRRRGSHPAVGHPAPDARRRRSPGPPASRTTTLEYSNVVRRIHEDPRVTLPYTPEQWAAVHRASARWSTSGSTAGDVRLTMGGEPTFVSIDDGTSAEWTIDADGPKKRERAGVLAERLRRIYAPQRCRAPRPGQVVSGRTVAALADRPALAGRRGAAVVRSGVAGRPWAAETSAEPDPPTDRRRTSGAEPDVAGAGSSPRSPTYFELPAVQVRPAYEDALGKLAQQVRMPAGEPVSRRPRPRTARTRAPSCCTSWTSRSPRPAPTCCRCTGLPRADPRRRHRRPTITGDPAARKSAPTHRLGQRRLAAAPRPDRAADRGLAGRSAAAAGRDLLGSRRSRGPEPDPLAAKPALPTPPTTRSRARSWSTPTGRRRTALVAEARGTACCTCSCRRSRSSTPGSS